MAPAGRLSGDRKQAAILWLACHDTDAANSEAAQRLVKAANVDFPQDFVRPLADQLPHDSADIRQAAALALAYGIKARLFLILSAELCILFATDHQRIELIADMLATIIPSYMQKADTLSLSCRCILRRETAPLW